MKTWECELRDPEGLHARPACMVASVAFHHHSQITISCQSKTASGNDIMELIGLGAGYGDRLMIEVCGEDEEETLEALKEVLGY